MASLSTVGYFMIFSERELRLTFAIYAVARPSVVCRLYATLVRPSQAFEIFGNFSTAFGTLAIR